MVLDGSGECHFGVSETETLTALDPKLIKKYQSHLEEASLIILDGNLPLDTMSCILEIASQTNIPGK